MYEIEIPLEVIFGDINEYPVTVIDNGSYLFYLVIDYISPSEIQNIFVAFLLAIIFILGLYFFIRRYLRPVQLMKDRIVALEKGDLKSKIKVLGDDELASLSKFINKLIKEISNLLENKHQVLLEVSHELRSPLARMQFLIEMLPDHKNNIKLRHEVNLLEGMIDNLLLSDRLSMPYSNLNLEKVKIDEIIKQIIELFPRLNEKIKISNSIPNEEIMIDKTKFIIAIRNLLDNAFKYSNNNIIELIINKTNNEIEFSVIDVGIGISKENINQITEPFFQANKTVTTIGFGLGLTICKKIIESHDGKLIIKSQEGKGSTFTLLLPVMKN
jgi:signal transduction histidine kinase